MPVEANFIADDFLHEIERFPKGSLPAGTAHLTFYDPPSNGVEATLSFVCPCGCGEHDFIFLSTKEPKPDRCWGWDGNREKPTATPSIFRRGAKCQWHGYLRAGQWVTA